MWFPDCLNHSAIRQAISKSLVAYDPSWNTDQGVQHVREPFGEQTRRRNESEGTVAVLRWEPSSIAINNVSCFIQTAGKIIT